jgi:UDP-glucuronate 4-epimerase
MRFLITGTAGFVGFHLSKRLLADGHVVHGFDGLTPYYDPGLKRARQAILEESQSFTTHFAMLEEFDSVAEAARAAAPDVIVHLAAQAGVRYSLENPRAYIDANLVGTFNVLEIAHAHSVRHLVLGSTSSIYGLDSESPFRELAPADHPVSLYAATKKSAELMSHCYSHLWQIPTTAARFFTVYGPWGRPDMALFSFVAAILEGRPIDVYGQGKMSRDFTYVDDIVEALVRLIDIVPAVGERSDQEDSLSPAAPWRAVNIGNGAPVKLMDFIAAIEKHVGRKATINLKPMQMGDVTDTNADTDLLKHLTGFRPSTSIDDGVKAFVDWYRSYYRT